MCDKGFEDAKCSNQTARNRWTIDKEMTVGTSELLVIFQVQRQKTMIVEYRQLVEVKCKCKCQMIEMKTTMAIDIENIVVLVDLELHKD